MARIKACAAFIAFSIAASAQSPAIYQRGAAAHHSGDCTAAIADLKASLETQPRAANLLGSCYLAVGNYPAAIALLEPMYVKAPGDPDVLNMLATAYEHTSRAAEFAVRVEEYLAKNPSDVAVRIRLARLYSANNEDGRASQHLKTAAAQQPDNPAVLAAMGSVALHQHQWVEAAALFRRAKAGVAQDLDVELGLSSALLATDNCAEAISPLRSAQELAPLEYSIAKKLATCHRKLEQWVELIGALRTGIAQEAADQEATSWMIEAFRSKGRPKETEEYLRWVIAQSPANLTARVALGDMLFAGNDSSGAEGQYTEAVRLNPGLVLLQYRLGQIAEIQKQPDKARKAYELASAAKDATVPMHEDLARVCLVLADLKCVRMALDRIDGSKVTPAARRMRVQLEYRSEDWKEVSRLAEMLRAQGEQDAALLKMAGEAELKLGNYQQSAELFEQAVLQTPDDKELVYKLSAIYSDREDLGRAGRAVELLRGFSARNKDDGEAILRLANLYRRNKNMEEARFNFTLGFKLLATPIPKDLSWAYVSFASFLLDDGKPEDALQNLQKATQVNPDDDTAQYNLGLMYLDRGRFDEAVVVQAKLHELKSDHAVELDDQVEKKRKPETPPKRPKN